MTKPTIEDTKRYEKLYSKHIQSCESLDESKSHSSVLPLLRLPKLKSVKSSCKTICSSTYMTISMTSYQDVNGFSEQHPWNAQDRNENEVKLNLTLTFVHVFAASVERLILTEQHHVNEEDQHRRCTSRREWWLGFRQESDPLPEHHEDHVSEQQHEENDLRQELQED